MNIFRRSLLVFTLVSTATDSFVAAQTWTGLGGDNKWSTVGNWDTAVPGSGNTATFNGPGNGNTNVSLSGGTQPIGTILFDNSPAAYALGTLSSGDQFNFDAGGAITVNNTVATPQSVNANIQTNGALTVNNNGSAGLTLSGNITQASGTIGSLLVPGTGIVQLTGTSTYTGDTRYTGAGTIIPVLVSSNGVPANSPIGRAGTFTAGPFGTGRIVFDNPVSPHLRPAGGDRLVSNNLFLTSGFVMENNPGESYNLTIVGGITMSDDGVISNQSVTGGTLYLGDIPDANAIALPTGGNFQLTLSAKSGPIVVNGHIINASGGVFPGSVRINPGPGEFNSILFNGSNEFYNPYSGGTYLGSANAGGGTVLIGTYIGSSPFGTGPIYPEVTNVSATAMLPTLMPHDNNRRIGNRIVMHGNIVFGNEPNTAYNLEVGGIYLTTADRTIINNMAGTLTVGGGTLGNATTGRQLEFRTDNADAKTIVGGILDPPGGGAGSIKISSGTVQITGSLTFGFPSTYSGGTFVTGGKLLVTGADDTTIPTGTGPVVISPGATLGGFGPVGGNIINNGILDPGLTQNPGWVFRGKSNFTDGDGAQWNIAVGGTLHDYVEIAGNLDLTAFDTLNITRSAGPGSSWVIAGYDGVLTGTFDNVTPGYTVDYGTGAGDLITVTALPVPGDYNNNGLVDAADYVIWRKTNGTATQLQNEVSGVTPGQVTQEDYDAWRARFGNTSGSGGGALDGSGGSVPEPASVLLILLGVAGLPAGLHCRRIA